MGVPVTGAQFALNRVKFELASGVAVSVTIVPTVKSFWHVVPQEIVPGLEVTVPPPVPSFAAINRLALKVVVTVAAADMVILHCVGVPATGVQLALKLPNVEVASGVAVSVTTVLGGKSFWHPVPVPHEIVPGLEVTVPPPVPAFDTISVNAFASNVVVTVAAADIVIVHWFGVLATGAQLALNRVKFELASGVAVSVTTVLMLKSFWHVVPQEIVPGLEVTVPPPVPSFAAISRLALKVVVTVAAADMVILHCVGVPVTGVQLVLKLPNVAVASGTAVSVTAVLAGKSFWHPVPVPHEIVPGLEVTEPPPVPAFDTVSVNVFASNVVVTVAAADIVILH